MSIATDKELLAKAAEVRAPFIKRIEAAVAKGNQEEALRIYAEMRAATREYDLPELTF